MPWAVTRYHGHKIEIYKLKRRDMDGAQGATDWHRGRCEIWISEDTFKKGKRFLERILTHEFIHVIEYMNDPGYLSPMPIENCTLLAQAMEDGLDALWNNFKLYKKPRKKPQNNSEG